MFLLKIYFANVNKSTGNCGFVYIYHKDINFREDLFSWMQIFRLSSGSQTKKKKKWQYFYKKKKKRQILLKNDKNDVFTSNFMNQKHRKVGGRTTQ